MASSRESPNIKTDSMFELQLACDTISKVRNSLKQEIESLKFQNASLSRENLDLKNKKSDRETSLEEQIRDLIGRNSILSQEKTNLTSELEKLRKRFLDQKSSRLREIDELEKLLEKERQSLRALKKSNVDLQCERLSALNELDIWKSRFEELKARVSRLEKDFEWLVKQEERAAISDRENTTGIKAEDFMVEENEKVENDFARMRGVSVSGRKYGNGVKDVDFMIEDIGGVGGGQKLSPNDVIEISDSDIDVTGEGTTDEINSKIDQGQGNWYNK